MPHSEINTQDRAGSSRPRLDGYGGSIQERRLYLKDLCPCRNGHVKDVETWRGIFDIALNGSLKERNAAAHAIGTLFTKARKSEDWRIVLLKLQPEIDVVMNDTRASRSLLGTMKKHGHAHRGAARKNFRKMTRIFDLKSPEELANWLNTRLLLPTANRVDASHTGVRRLAKWTKHRSKFQPNRNTKESEILAQAKQFMPDLFEKTL